MNKFDIWYSTVRLGRKIKLILLKKFKTSKKIWEYAVNEDFCFGEDFKEEKIKKFLRASWNHESIKIIEDIMYKQDIKLVDYYNDMFPNKLKHFDDTPSLLFYKGDLKPLNTNKSVAIVGSRKYSYYGEAVAKMLGKQLAKNSINVISGMAKGIDAFAHTACLQNEGYTCAVLGCGLDIIYPAVNKKIYYDILKKGAIISEFPPGTKPFNYNFPLRNRIISGVSDLVIVVEAADKSGSLITASCALSQGKDVMAVPGSVFSKMSVGTNKLIRDGAYPLTSLEDMFNLINIDYTKENNDKTKFSSGLHKQIYMLINDKPLHIDEIIRTTGVDTKSLYNVLFELQLKNQITCLNGNYYVRIANSI